MTNIPFASRWTMEKLMVGDYVSLGAQLVGTQRWLHLHLEKHSVLVHPYMA